MIASIPTASVDRTPQIRTPVSRSSNSHCGLYPRSIHPKTRQQQQHLEAACLGDLRQARRLQARLLCGGPLPSRRCRIYHLLYVTTSLEHLQEETILVPRVLPQRQRAPRRVVLQDQYYRSIVFFWLTSCHDSSSRESHQYVYQHFRLVPLRQQKSLSCGSFSYSDVAAGFTHVKPRPASNAITRLSRIAIVLNTS